MSSKVIEVSKEDALAICARQESDFFDRKARGISPKKVQKIAVAVSNADGGEFVVGVSDDRDKPNLESR